MNILEVNSITKYYGDHLAADNISFEIPKGIIVGLLGPNGAGKTTLIRTLTKIIEPDRGSLVFDGEQITLKTAKRFGYLPEERGLYKKMKVHEQLLFLARLKGLSKESAKQKIDLWLEKFSISDWKDKKIEDLSKGMQQKIQFIAAVLHEPELLILDEPFSGFDPVNTEVVTKEILRLKEKGVTIIFSTHRMESVEELCEHILFIHQSKLMLSSTTKDVKEQYRNSTYKIKHTSVLDMDTPQRFELITSEPMDDYISSVIKLNKETTIKEVLSHLWSQQEIIAFEEKIPSIKEIFISTVTSPKNYA